MIPFESWPTLKKYYEEGSLLLIDLCFANSILKKVHSNKEEHAALLAVLFAISREGHLALDCSTQALSNHLTQEIVLLVQQGAATFPECAWICRHEEKVYLTKNWNYVTEIMTHLNRLSSVQSDPEIPVFPENTSLNSPQQEAIRKGLTYPVSFLTGGPGTGKTYTAAELVKTCLAITPDKKEFRIILTAPTGKAVSALEKNLKPILTDVPYQVGTLHAILGIKEHEQEQSSLPIFADLILVDECSMIDARIFARLLAAICQGARLVLIGDKDQLPPVEAGSIFADLIDLHMFPTTELTECLRSDLQSLLAFSKLIRDGNVEGSLAFLKAQTEIEWIDPEGYLPMHFWNRFKDRYVRCFSEKPTLEALMGQKGTFAILSCMRQGPLGTDALNSFFVKQSLIHAKRDSWWTGPIMITRNDYSLDLYNGDVGFLVRKVGLESYQIEDFVLFPQTGRQIPALALKGFEYSYALSVHKSQGSEYDEILILAPPGSEHFGREVLYTAVTRARQKVFLAASQDLLRQAIGTSSRKVSGLQKMKVFTL